MGRPLLRHPTAGDGIPAGYVAGYLYAKGEADVGEKVVGESHAWVVYFCSDWVGIDPTNGGRVGLFTSSSRKVVSTEGDLPRRSLDLARRDRGDHPGRLTPAGLSTQSPRMNVDYRGIDTHLRYS